MEWRWLVARVWDRLFRRSCWAETAAWSFRTPGCRLRIDADGRGSKGYCPDAAKDPGGDGCWCGKFRPREGD